MVYFRFLKKQQEEKKLKEEKRLKEQEEKKLKEEEEKKNQTGKNIVKIFRFAAQLIIAALLVLVMIYAIF